MEGLTRTGERERRGRDRRLVRDTRDRDRDRVLARALLRDGEGQAREGDPADRAGRGLGELAGGTVGHHRRDAADVGERSVRSDLDAVGAGRRGRGDITLAVLVDAGAGARPGAGLTGDRARLGGEVAALGMQGHARVGHVRRRGALGGGRDEGVRRRFEAEEAGPDAGQAGDGVAGVGQLGAGVADADAVLAGAGRGAAALDVDAGRDRLVRDVEREGLGPGRRVVAGLGPRRAGRQHDQPADADQSGRREGDREAPSSHSDLPWGTEVIGDPDHQLVKYTTFVAQTFRTGQGFDQSYSPS